MRAWEKDLNRKTKLILRVSSDAQRNNYSHEVQEKVCRDYCKKNRLDIVGDPIKLAESAKESEGRKRYHETLKQALKQGCKHLVFFMQDREARNPTDVTDNIKLVRTGKIVLHYAHENKQLDEDSSASEFTMRQMQGVMDWQYSMVLSEKVSQGQKHKAESGVFPGGKAPLGYMHVRPVDENGKIIPRAPTDVVPDKNERNVQLVKRMFELRAKSFSLEAICETVIKEGLVVDCKKFTKSVVEFALKNKFYYGKFDWDGKEYVGKHELFVPQKHRRIVLESFNKRGRGVAYGPDEAIFAGWMRCGNSDCGMQISYERRKKVLKSGETKIYPLYRCSNSRRLHKTFKGHYVSEQRLFEDFESAIKQVDLSPNLADEISAALTELHRKSQKKIRDEMDAYRVAIADLRKDEDKAYDRMSAGAIDGVTYRRQIERIRSKQDHFTALLEQAQLAINDAWLITAKNIFELAKSAKDLWDSGEYSKRLSILKELCLNPVLDGPTLRYDLRKPYAVLVKMKGSEDWSG